METAIYKKYLPLDRLGPSAAFLADLGRKNIIALINPQRYEHGSFKGTLSIKTAFAGQEYYGVDSIEKKVTPHNYLLVNSDVSYSHFIEDDHVNALTLFFAKGYVESILRSYTHRPECLLDDGFAMRQEQICLLQGLNTKSQRMSFLLDKIKTCTTATNSFSQHHIDELLFYVATEVLVDQNKIIKERIQPLSATKKITRVELYKRVSRAKDYIESTIDRELDLNTLATVSNLSKFHFLRVFKEVYRLTPYQYLMKQRITEAKDLLKNSKLSTVEIAQKTGFNHAESFYRLFVQQVGVTPTTFRENSNIC